MRCNAAGELHALSYARPAAVAIDPIEKKPLMNFLPGTRTLSLGAFGCNLDCCFCQNSSLSRGTYNANGDWRILTPREAVSLAAANDCPSISLTYNEPTLWIEYAMDIAKLARASGLRTVLVTNGFIEPEPARALYPARRCRQHRRQGVQRGVLRVDVRRIARAGQNRLRNL